MSCTALAPVGLSLVIGAFCGRAISVLPHSIHQDEPLTANLRAMLRWQGLERRDWYEVIGLALVSAAALAGLATAVPAMPWLFGFGIAIPVLLALAAIDYRAFLLPDLLIVVLGVTGLLLSLYAPLPGAGLPLAVIAGALGAGGLWLLRAYYRWRRNLDALGFGDIKLMAAGGFWVGPAGLPWVILAGALLTLILAFCRSLLTGEKLTATTAAPLGFGLCLALIGISVWIAVSGRPV